MSDRETALRNLSVGDIFHARSPNGASLVCLVTRIDEDTIHARRIHTQDDLLFNRRTGIKSSGAPSRIDCIAPFPPDIHQIFLAMDQKHRVNTELWHQGVEPTLEQRRLTPDQSRANRFVDAHVATHLI
ncbi:MAG TPA: hypothetical protein VG651_13830 [Stellaceae bacterium]|nr:hypothetical protein [Stellaceae bacterium]